MSKVPERKEVKEQYKWDLNDLVSGDVAWEKKFADVDKAMPSLLEYKGKLGDDKDLLAFLKREDEIVIDLLKLYLYAGMNSHVDMRVKKYQEMNSKAEMLAVKIGTLTAFAEPEICERSAEQLIILSKNPDFSDYSYRFERLAKDKKYVLSEKEEAILSEPATLTETKDRFEMSRKATRLKFAARSPSRKSGNVARHVVVLLQKPYKTSTGAFESNLNAFKNI